MKTERVDAFTIFTFLPINYINKIITLTTAKEVRKPTKTGTDKTLFSIHVQSAQTGGFVRPYIASGLEAVYYDHEWVSMSLLKRFILIIPR